MVGDSKQPLLKKVYYENCSGCKVEKYLQTRHGFPIKELFAIWFVVLTTALPISSLFPFLYFMIQDFHIAEREEDIGYYAGYVGSAFMLGRVLTSVLWGVIADRYGRRPVINFGLVAVVICNTLFGLSTNFWMAITMRFLVGSLNGSLVPIRAYASEIFTKEYQALGLSTISTAWGIGLVIGPALGGFLAKPADKYPNVFSKESLFGRFPYFLPCLCISVFAFGVCVASFWLPETLHMHHENNKTEDGSYEALEAATSVSSLKQEKGRMSKAISLLMNWPLMSSIIVYCVFSLHDMAYTEIFSLWAVSPRKFGGLGYSTQNVGEVLSVSGLGLLFFQLSLYPLAEKILGPIMVARISGALSIPLLQSYPYIAMLSGLSLSVVLNCASVIKNSFSVSIITGLFILQNTAVDQHERGAATGISMTLMSLAKTIGPAGGGTIFSWAQKRQDAAFLPGVQMVFFLLNVVALIGMVMTFRPFLVRRNDKESSNPNKTNPG